MKVLLTVAMLMVAGTAALGGRPDSLVLKDTVISRTQLVLQLKQELERTRRLYEQRVTVLETQIGTLESLAGDSIRVKR